MDIISQVGLDVTRVVDTANPALFCTRWGGPITFHLQVGDGEEILLKPIQRAINSFGGRYVKRYHEMTPYTILLVTDRGFRKDTFNRPAVCVTYIGDCVFTNSLRNVNEYLHPWDDETRWKKVDLTAVMYSQIKMFQCSPRYILNKPYIPVSRKTKIVQGPEQKPSIKNLSESSESSQLRSDDDLFNKEEQLTTISLASTNLRSNPCDNFVAELLIKVEEDTQFVRCDERPAVAEEGLENPRPDSSDDHCFLDDRRSISGANQRVEVPFSQRFENKLKDINTESMPLQKLRLTSLQKSSDNLRDSANCDDGCMTADDSVLIDRSSMFDRDVIPTVAATVTNQKEQSQTSQNQKKFKRKNVGTESKPRKSDNREDHPLFLRVPHVLLERIPESVIQDKMSTILVWCQKNTKNKSVHFNASTTSENSTKKHNVSRSGSLASLVRNTNEETQFGIGDVMPNQKHSGFMTESGRCKDQMPLRTVVPLERTSERESPDKMSAVVALAKKNPQKISADFSPPSTPDNKKSKPAAHKKGNFASVEGNSKVEIPEKDPIQRVQGRNPPKEKSGISNPSTSQKNAHKKLVGEPSANPIPKIALIRSSPSHTSSGPSKKDNKKAIGGKSLGNQYSRLQTSIEVRKTRVGKNRQRRRDSTNDEEALSVEGSSSTSDVQCDPIQIPPDRCNDFPLPSHEDEPEIGKKRGRGFQDRYRTWEKVALLRWLVERKKFRNLRGVLVWKEMERNERRQCLFVYGQ